AKDTTTGAQQPMGARGATVADTLGGCCQPAVTFGRAQTVAPYLHFPATSLSQMMVLDGRHLSNWPMEDVGYPPHYGRQSRVQMPLPR
ncbi:MAG: hypothetical protein EOS07_12715, partial [Mesorhizobium sp.]